MSSSQRPFLVTLAISQTVLGPRDSPETVAGSASAGRGRRRTAPRGQGRGGRWGLAGPPQPRGGGRPFPGGSDTPAWSLLSLRSRGLAHSPLPPRSLYGPPEGGKGRRLARRRDGGAIESEGRGSPDPRRHLPQAQVPEGHGEAVFTHPGSSRRCQTPTLYS